MKTLITIILLTLGCFEPLKAQDTFKVVKDTLKLKGYSEYRAYEERPSIKDDSRSTNQSNWPQYQDNGRPGNDNTTGGMIKSQANKTKERVIETTFTTATMMAVIWVNNLFTK